MSRQNKVNPGMYTQRGRLTQDDVAREVTRQRALGSQATWQPGQHDKMPHFKGSPPNPEKAAEGETVADVEEEAPKPRARKKQSRVKVAAKPAARKAAKKAAKTPKRAAKTPAKSVRATKRRKS